MRNAVDIGITFEKKVLETLQACGLEAYRTNRTNIHDPEGYKHGHDGGVDIIAAFHTSVKAGKDLVFFIQCKNQQHPLEKSAISQVYAGMHSRHGFGDCCIPVVVATCEASQETMQYAKGLKVELFLQEQFDILKQADVTGRVPYGNYGSFLKVLLYHFTKDTIWIDTLPDNPNILAEITMTEQLLMDTKTYFDKAQTCLDNAERLERKAREERQKALDIQKVAAFRSIQMASQSNAARENHTKEEKPSVTEDPG